MTLPSSGQIALTDVQAEFGGSGSISLSEYYAGGGYVPGGTSGTAGAVPSSGQITLDQFHGTTAFGSATHNYYSGSGTEYVPAGATSLEIQIDGGGGGGGHGYDEYYGEIVGNVSMPGGGGGGGGRAILYKSISSSDWTYPMSFNVGGGGGSGSAGGDSWVSGSLPSGSVGVTAYGGGAGAASTGGGAGTAAGGSVHYNGVAGTNDGNGGKSGSNADGGLGTYATGGAPIGGSSYGGGGGGGAGSGYAGAAGAPGKLVFIWD